MLQTISPFPEIPHNENTKTPAKRQGFSFVLNIKAAIIARMNSQTDMTQTPYANLSPELVLDATEALTGRATGGIFAMNSYENRVYDVALEEGNELGKSVVAKFYRPHRWSKETIQEEHNFTLEMQSFEVPVVAPYVFEGKTLFEHKDYMYALFPKRGGRPFEPETDEDLRQLGRLLARVHNVGAMAKFEHRMPINVKTFGWDNLEHLKASGMVAENMREAFFSIAEPVLNLCEAIWGESRFDLRLHGDCHLGNILVAQEPFLVDLDDCVSGPAVQDVWMLLSGEQEEMRGQMAKFLEGYTQLRDFNTQELRLIEVLRSLRMIHYSAWLARRWNDPTFPKNFPFFGREDYWQGLVLNLKEQLSLLQDPMEWYL
tara:strand:- start:507485 stop:508603 length:1119 start_codon:yes stop_codon:yes gene_type:complete